MGSFSNIFRNSNGNFSDWGNFGFYSAQVSTNNWCFLSYHRNLGVVDLFIIQRFCANPDSAIFYNGIDDNNRDCFLIIFAKIVQKNLNSYVFDTKTPSGSEQLSCRAPSFAPKDSVFALDQHYCTNERKAFKTDDKWKNIKLP